jgi:hypothetical protein
LPHTEERQAVPQRRGKRDTSSSKAALEGLAEKSVVQLRLRGEESAWLAYSMRALGLDSTSEALREGLRLLHREAVEVEAAHHIQAFYQDEPAPLPDAVVPAEEAELAAADAAEW